MIPTSAGGACTSAVNLSQGALNHIAGEPPDYTRTSPELSHSVDLSASPANSKFSFPSQNNMIREGGLEHTHLSSQIMDLGRGVIPGWQIILPVSRALGESTTTA